MASLFFSPGLFGLNLFKRVYERVKQALSSAGLHRIIMTGSCRGASFIRLKFAVGTRRKVLAARA